MKAQTKKTLLVLGGLALVGGAVYYFATKEETTSALPSGGGGGGGAAKPTSTVADLRAAAQKAHDYLAAVQKEIDSIVNSGVALDETKLATLKGKLEQAQIAYRDALARYNRASGNA